MMFKRSSLLRAALLAVAPLAFTACISGGRTQGYPLYPPSEPPPAQEQLAHLLGYVQVVDGRDVSSLGTSFDLLPGWHVVQTPSQWGHTELNAGGVAWNTGHLTYKMQMKAGYSYVIKVEIEKTGGITYRGGAHAYESDGRGAVTQTFHPIASHP